MSCTQVHVQVAHRIFVINFAGPYVTSVGGTTGMPAEVASSFSGGGFSRYFGVEKYQRYDSIAYVLTLGDEHVNRYKVDGRGVPDISAQSSQYTLIYARKEKRIDSTVCSTSVRLTFTLRSDLPILEHLAELR